MNCGAPIKIDANKCPYCGTSYLDICGLKLDGATPAVLKYEANYNGQKIVVSALVVAESTHSITSTYNTVHMSNNSCVSFIPNVDTELELHFRLVPDKDGRYLTMTTEE